MNQKNECRFCNAPLNHTFCDLGMSPFSNSYLTADSIKIQEPFYPLHTYVCENCYLVQLQEFESPEHIFSDYAYFSSYSNTWLEHAKAYTEKMVSRFGFDCSSHVIEIASNDGYLLKYFKEKNVPVLGIEPAENVAKIARDAGIPSLIKFFGTNTANELAAEGKCADLLLGNNVLAHVPDINDFVRGMKILLKSNGVITMEFPHLLSLINQRQFDTIYHEHLSYLSFLTVRKIFAKHGLTLFDVEELSTHGGSLRIYARHSDASDKAVTERVAKLLKKESEAGLDGLAIYLAFAERVKEIKWELLEFLIKIKRDGKSIVAYGAPAKGNTLLNYCGIRTDFIDYTVDRSPHKQNLYLPGVHIPIFHPDKIKETKPDFLLILPWNLKDEIIEQMAYILSWGGKFAVLIPAPKILP